MRRSLQIRSASPPGPLDRRPYLQRPGSQAASSTPSPRGGQGIGGMYVAEAIPIKSARSTRPFPSGSSFGNPSSSEVGSHAERLVRSAGILPSKSPAVGGHFIRSPTLPGQAPGVTSVSNHSQSDTNDRPDHRFIKPPSGRSGEILERVIANTPTSKVPVLLSNRRSARDRDQGNVSFAGVGTTERIPTNIFSLSGNKGRRNPLGGGVIPLAAGIRPRDREYPHPQHHQQDDSPRNEHNKNPGFSSSTFSSLSRGAESNPTSRSSRIISKVLGAGSAPNAGSSGPSTNGGGGSSHPTTSTSSNEGPRGEGNRLVVKRRRDGDLEDLEDNTPLGLVSFFDGIRVGMMGRGKEMQNLNNFDEFRRHGSSSPGQSSNNNSPRPSSKASRTVRDSEDLNSTRMRSSNEYNFSNSNSTSRKNESQSQSPRQGKPTLTTASERQKDIHERYGGDRPSKIPNFHGRHIGSYSRVTEEKTPTASPSKPKHGSPSPTANPHRQTSITSSPSSHPFHPKTSNDNLTNPPNPNTNAKPIQMPMPRTDGGIRSSTPSSSVKGEGTHFIEVSRPDNPPLNPSSTSPRNDPEIATKQNPDARINKTATMLFNKLNISLKTKGPIGSHKALPLPDTSSQNRRDFCCPASSSGNAINNATNNTADVNASSNSQGFCPHKNNDIVNNGHFGPRVHDRHHPADDDDRDTISPLPLGASRAIVDDNNTPINNESGSDTDADDEEECDNSDYLDAVNNNEEMIKSGLDNGSVKDKSDVEKKCHNCKVLAKSQAKFVLKVKTLQKNNGNMESLLSQKRELVEQLQQQMKVILKENQHLAKIVVNSERTKSGSKSTTPNLINLNNGKPSAGLGFPISGKSTTSPVIPIRQTLSEGNCPAIQRKTVSSPSFLSSIQSLNAHRKVAISPEHLKEAEDKISSLSETCDKLTVDLETTKSERGKMQKFLGDLLYTLNGRGYESVTDAQGNVINLNRCKGESYLELKGRDQRQKAPVRRVGGNEVLLKAVIGSQEKMIQNLIAQIDAIQRDLLIGDKLSSSGLSGGEGEGSKSAALEGEMLELMTLVEGTVQRCPEVFIALRDQHQLDSELTRKGNSSARMMNSKVGQGIVQKILDRCGKLAGSVRHPNSRQSQDHFPPHYPTAKPRTSESRSRRHRDKESSGSSRRHYSEESLKPGRHTRRLRSSGGGPNEESNNNMRSSSQPIISTEFIESEDTAGRPDSGSGTLDNQNHRHHPNQGDRRHRHEPFQGDPLDGTEEARAGHNNTSNSSRRRRPSSSSTDMKSGVGTGNENNPRVSEPINASSSEQGSVASYSNRDERYCPYCEMALEPHMSPDDVQEHIEAHLFHCDP